MGASGPRPWFLNDHPPRPHALTGPRKLREGPSGVTLTFSTLGLQPESLRAIADQGYTDPTPVQSRAIPAILDG